MCGVTGFLDADRATDAATLEARATRMSDAIIHRGPDDSGAWVDPACGIALGFRRLAIVDLSPTGHQPMISHGGRFVIVFNGEIYNYPQLRAEVEAGTETPTPWRGRSDTEVLLAGFERWGLEETIKRAVGMFAIAAWDRRERTLKLVRDRLGEKPMYYGWQGRTFLFASELKALRAHPDFNAGINRDALIPFLRTKYIPAPLSIYQGIAKLPPASILTLRGDDPEREPRVETYWSAREVVEAGVAHPFTGSDEEAREQLDALLRQAVRLQMVADVPLGALLSGGIDSSTIVSLMQAQSERPIRTFTIGFHEPGFNEAEHAKAITQHLGTEHTELYLTPDEALAVIPRLPALYDEPYADASQIPTFLVARMAREHVTVALSGDAGDELFAGYTRYLRADRLGGLMRMTPRSVRTLAGKGLTAVPQEQWDRAFDAVGSVLPARVRQTTPGEKIHKLGAALAATSVERMHLSLVSDWPTPAEVVPGGAEPLTMLADPRGWARLDDVRQRMMFLDLVTYLPDDILCKVDRASMGVSLECRAPYLDHRVVEFAWRVPMGMKIRDGQGKWLLRQVLDRYVPRELIERPKAGFSVPIRAWLRGPLRDWADDLLAEERLRADGLFDPGPIRQKWVEHRSGRRSWQHQLWSVLMAQAWLDAWR